jgi:alpha-tubulin suppressor-like RCC1 family protein
MPTFYNYTEGGQTIALDDVFVPADAFRQGNLWGWGFNAYGKLGTNDTSNRPTPVPTFSGGANWKQVSCGRQYTTAIKTDGTLWIWGYSQFGALGINIDTATSRPTPVTTFAGGTNWKQVSGGYAQTVAIKTDGTLWAWGYGGHGNLGTNDTTQRNTPVTTFAGGTNWKQVASGSIHVAAIKTDGTLWTWGNNDNGQLGINDTTKRSTPVTTFLGGTNWKQVSCGLDHTAAIKTDGTLWTWGNNEFGKLGINVAGTTNGRTIPVTTFAGGTNWKQVACGQYNISAIKTDGTLWIWGSNSSGQLGTGDTNGITHRCTPVTTFLGGTNWKQVAGGMNFFTAAIKTDGTLWTWGANYYGELGTQTNLAALTSRFTPTTTLAGGNNWKQVSCGQYMTTATTYIDDYI